MLTHTCTLQAKWGIILLRKMGYNIITVHRFILQHCSNASSISPLTGYLLMSAIWSIMYSTSQVYLIHSVSQDSWCDSILGSQLHLFLALGLTPLAF